MKPEQINKLYSKLQPIEQATLVIEAAAKKDWGTVDAIIEKVERVVYRDYHNDYTRRLLGLQLLAANYGIEYWKTRALMLLSKDYAEAGYVEAELPATKFLAKAVALETAIVEICTQLKVDVTAMREMAGCIGNDALPKQLPEVDVELVKEYSDMFTAFLS